MVTGTEGERAIDISSLRETTGLITLDPSLANTAMCQSAITFIDGDKGILRYRGIPIEELAQDHPNFIEVAWLLMYGRLPDRKELTSYSRRLTDNEAIQRWMWLCALAYWQLLLMSREVEDLSPAWYLPGMPRLGR